MRRKHGSRTSHRAYRIEHDRYAEFQFRVKLTKVESIIKELSRLCEVEKPRLKFRSMSRTLGHYRTGGKIITISSQKSTIRFGTIVHEFAHHLNFVKDNTCGHDAKFFRALDRAYSVARKRYSTLIEKNKDDALTYKETRRRAELTQSYERKQFRVGQRVVFKERKGRGRLIVARVQDILPKNIRVQEVEDRSRTWRVSPSVLKLVESV